MPQDADLNVARKNLSAELGDKMKIYFQILKSWFKQKITREDFDHEARNLLTKETVQLHNEFLLAILNKCQSVGPALSDVGGQRISSESRQRAKKEKMKRKLAVYNTSITQRFVAADPLSQAPVIPPQFPDQNDRLPEYVSREMLLPDSALVHGRLIVSAWEFGLDNVEDEAVHLLLEAVQTELRALISAMVSRRRGYRVHEKRFKHSHSCQTVSMLNRNSSLCDVYKSEGPTCISTGTGQLVPSVQPSADMKMRNSALLLADSSDLPTNHNRLTMFDLLEALMVHRSTLPSHTVYTLNVERILDRMSHPTNEEILQDQIRAQEYRMRQKIELEAL